MDKFITSMEFRLDSGGQIMFCADDRVRLTLQTGPYIVEPNEVKELMALFTLLLRAADSK